MAQCLKVHFSPRSVCSSAPSGWRVGGRREQVSALIEAARRLAEPDAMGQLFKVMAISSANCPPLPGFLTERRAQAGAHGSR